MKPAPVFGSLTIDAVVRGQRRLDTALTVISRPDPAMMEDRKRLTLAIRHHRHKPAKRPDQNIATTCLGDMFPLDTADRWIND